MPADEHYELREELGRGGMGIVYKALDPSLNRIIALKVLPKHLGDSATLVKRFQREASAAAGLNHPNIVTVYAIGKQDGSFHIAMEYVDGMSLAQLIGTEGRQDVRRVVEFMRQAADALAEAHSKDIIHRDIKPHNIMLDKNDRIKVADFGLARVVEADTELTADGTRLGTPRYMSPEQCDTQPLTFHSDIYSLGVVMFELLAGRAAFEAESNLALMRLIVDSPFPDILDINDEVPPEVGRIIAKMVSKKPLDRYRSAVEMSEDLDCWLRTGMAPGAAGAVLSQESGAAPVAPSERAPAQAEPGKRDFIIHFVESDRTWAEWIHSNLSGAGYAVKGMVWDRRTSHESLRRAMKAVDQSVTMIVVVSPPYLTALHADREWENAYRLGQLEVLPIIVRTCAMGGTFRTTDYINMVELDRDRAKEVLLEEALERRGDRRGADGADAKIEFEQFLEERAPSKLLHAVWNVPYASNPDFTGREEFLTNIYSALSAGFGMATLVQAKPQHSGFGLTQLAIEYAHLNRSDYGVVWWIRASRRAVLLTDYLGLATELGLPEKEAKKFGVVTAAIKKWLAENENWLLIFDQAVRFRDIEGFLPEKHKGHVLATSPNRKWPKKARPLSVGRLARAESVDFLFKRTDQRNEGAGAALAAILVDVPLALTIAGSYIKVTGMSLDTYIDQFLVRHKSFWGYRDPPKDSLSVVTSALSLTLGRVALESKNALDLLKACSYLAPTNIRLSRMSAGAKLFPKTLTKTLSNTTKVNDAVATLKRYSLIEEREDSLWLHPMVQELTRSWLEADASEEENEDRLELIERLRYTRLEMRDPHVWIRAVLGYMKDVFPENCQNSDTWKECGLFLPHVLSVARHAERLEAAPSDTAEIWRRTGAYLYERAEYRRAANAYERAIRFHVKAHGKRHKALSRLYKELAHVHQARSDLHRARSDYEAALAIDRAVLGKAHEEIATTLYNLGNILMRLGDLAGARQQYLRALEMDKKVRGADHADVGRDYTSLGLVSQELGDLTAAWEYYRNALEICEAYYGSKHPRVSAAVKNLGGLYQKMGDLAKAKESYKRAMEIDTEIHGEHHPDVAQDHNNLGLVLQGLGFVDEALESYKRALAIDNAVYGSKHPKVAINMNNVANILRGQGDLEGAEAYYKDAAKVFGRALGDNHDYTRTAVRNLKKIRAQRRQDKSGPRILE